MLSPVRVNPVLAHPAERRSAVADGWRFRLDPDDRGLEERWYARPDAIAEPIAVPGSWQGQGFGHDGPDLVWDFRLECRTFRATYRGTGWYAVSCGPPAAWQGQRTWLFFGGAHPSAEVWLNGTRLGENSLPFVPFGFEVTELVRAGQDNALVVRVHEANRELGFAYSWQGNWSGLYRQVEWRATGSVCLAGCRIHPDLDADRVRVVLALSEATTGGTRYRVTVQPWDRAGPGVEQEGRFDGPAAEVTVPVSHPEPWSPDAPNLYQVGVAVYEDDAITDAWTDRVGFVKLAPQGKHFCINGQPYYLRGTGDFLSCPETGCPDWDRDRWRRKLRALREYGYNYVRLQSYVYGPEYYDAADEVGLLVQSEMGMLGGWGSHTQWHVYAWPPPTPGYREELRRQWNRVVERDANHPSANLYCMSNELGDGTHFPRIAHRCARETRAIKPSALVLYTDGGLNESLPQDFVNAEAACDARTERPVIQHEFRWWSSFPDVRQMERYSGALRPYAAQLALEAARRHGVDHLLEEGVWASQRLQLGEAKGKMEACRRGHPRLAGICHFNAMDANPSPQGIITEMYEPKAATASQWQQTNGDTVVLCSLGFDDRVRVGGEPIGCNLYVSDFSHPPFQQPALRWELVGDGQSVASGQRRQEHAPFCTCDWGRIEFAAPEVDKPAVVELHVRLEEGERVCRNAWRLWILPPEQTSLPADVAVYPRAEYTWLRALAAPRPVARPAGAKVLLTERLDEGALEFLRTGGRAVLAASEGLVRPFNPKFGYRFGQYYFTPPANYPPYEDGHDGIIVHEHALLGDFPHEGFADLQFFRPIAQAPPLELEPLGLNDREPVIRPMHSYPVGRSLGYLLEGAVGAGRLVVCALELDQSWAEGRYLLNAVCRYLLDDQRPAPRAFTEQALEALVSGTSF